MCMHVYACVYVDVSGSGLSLFPQPLLHTTQHPTPPLSCPLVRLSLPITDQRGERDVNQVVMASHLSPGVGVSGSTMSIDDILNSLPSFSSSSSSSTASASSATKTLSTSQQQQQQQHQHHQHRQGIEPPKGFVAVEVEDMMTTQKAAVTYGMSESEFRIINRLNTQHVFPKQIVFVRSKDKAQSEPATLFPYKDTKTPASSQHQHQRQQHAQQAAATTRPKPSTFRDLLTRSFSSERARASKQRGRSNTASNTASRSKKKDSGARPINSGSPSTRRRVNSAGSPGTAQRRERERERVCVCVCTCVCVCVYVFESAFLDARRPSAASIVLTRAFPTTSVTRLGSLSYASTASPTRGAKLSTVPQSYVADSTFDKEELCVYCFVLFCFVLVHLCFACLWCGRGTTRICCWLLFVGCCWLLASHAVCFLLCCVLLHCLATASTRASFTCTSSL